MVYSDRMGRAKHSAFNKSSFSLFFIPLFLSFLLLSAGCSIAPAPPDLYALVYGVSEYDESISYNGCYFPALEYTDDDAIEMAALLEQKGYEVQLRLNNGGTEGALPATKEQLEKDLSKFAPSLPRNALLIVYFSGHGAQSSPLGWETSGDEDQFSDPYDEYIIFYQTDPVYKNHAVSDTYMAALLGKAGPLKKVLIIDACQSGGFIGQSSDFDAVEGDYSLDDARKEGIYASALNAFLDPGTGDILPDNTIVLTASGEREASFESLSYGHGVFTYGILQAAEKADYDDNGYIDTGELFQFSKDFLAANWNTYVYPKDQYHPHISGGPVDYVLFEAD
jgi:hypothetical protein